MTLSPRQQAVLAAVRQWQTRLLQLDRRNALLYFPTGKRGVRILGVEPDVILERLETTRSGLTFTYAERIRAKSEDLFPVLALPEEQEAGVRIRSGDLDTDLPPLELQK